MLKERYIRISLFIIGVSAIFIFAIVYSFNLVKSEKYSISLNKINDNIQEVSTDLNSNRDKNIYVTKERKEENIDIYYPVTGSKKFNQIVEKLLIEYINKVKESKENSAAKPWALQITYNVDKYSEQIYSFVFNITIEEGGRYPSTYIETITYDFSKDKNLNLRDILKNYDSQIIEISNICYNELIQNKDIINLGNMEQVKKGTNHENIYNFNKFSLEKNVLIIYFERYSVAPYVVGELNVCIPLQDISINENL